MLRPLLVLVSLAVALGVVGPAAAGPAPREAVTAVAYAQNNGACLDSEEQAFLGLINNYRAQNGLGPLVASHMLAGSADFHSTQMADYNYFSHTLLNGVSWADNIRNFGYTANTYLGENLAAGNSGAANTFTQWKNSPGHNANMLSPIFTAIGIGRAYNANATYDWYWTNTFGGHVYSGDAAVNCAAPAPAPSTTTVSSGTKYTIVRSYRSSNSYSSLYSYDANAKTAWTTYSASTPPRYATIWFDLGASKRIGSIRWQFLVGRYADAVKVQVSNDRTTWTTVGRITNPPAGAWQSLAVGREARYVRFYFANPNKDLRLGGLAEVAIIA